MGRGHDFQQDLDEALIEGLVETMRQAPAALGSTAELARRAGVGAAQLTELFHRYYHVSPAAMRSRLRFEAACRALLESDRPPGEIAVATGHETPASFEVQFRRLGRLTPTAYRRLLRERSFELELPARFQTRRMLRYLGRDPQSVNEAVAGNRFVTAVVAAGEPLVVTVDLEPRLARCRYESKGGSPVAPEAAASVHRQVLRLLGLVIDPTPFERRVGRDPQLARLITGRRGLSIPQTRDLFDGLLWVIAGQQVSLAVAFGMRRRLSELAGHRVAEGLYAPPTAAAVAALDEVDLRQKGGFSQRKSEYVTAIARQVAGGELDLEALAGRPATVIDRTLLALRGLGPWSVNYLGMRAFGLADCVPIGDAGLARSLTRFFALERRPQGAEMAEWLRAFAPYRSLATFHLWTLLEKDP